MTTFRHLTDLASLPDAVFYGALDRSISLREMMDRGAWPLRSLDGRLQFNLFYENSTRTSLSFEVAAKRLGAIVSMVPVAASSIHKGESLEDTVLTLCAQGADYLVLRATERGTISRAITAIEADGWPTCVLNAGEGALGHPTQGLLDAATLLHRLGRRASDGLQDQTLAICGDVLHSRVAASAIEAFSRLGATIRLVGPADLLPRELPEGVSMLMTDLAQGLDGVDVAMALRIQHERIEGAIGLPIDAYHERFGLNHTSLGAAKPNCLVMHPGPMNRGIEMDSALADDPERSLIRSQVRQGVALRMAVLEKLEGGSIS